MKTLTSILIMILLALAISIDIKNDSLQRELYQLNEDKVRTEWINAAAIENNDTIIIGDGCK